MTQEQIDAYLAQNPHDRPENNEKLKAAVNTPDYEDRGMWGPLGGKGGTVSQLWVEEHERLNSGAPSEFGLMTVVPPAGAMVDAQEQ